MSVPAVVEGDASEPAFSTDVDALLNPSERAQRTAWLAHVESSLGDLVVRTFALLSSCLAVNLKRFFPRLMPCTHSPKITLLSCIPRYHRSIKFHRPTTCLSV